MAKSKKVGRYRFPTTEADKSMPAFFFKSAIGKGGRRELRFFHQGREITFRHWCELIAQAVH